MASEGSGVKSKASPDLSLVEVTRLPQTLSELLAPCAVKDFLATSWGKSYQHIPGRPGKFAKLLPWGRLNDILQQHRLDSPRIRLVQNGQVLDSKSFIEYHRSKRRQFLKIPRLLPNELTDKLREGATLVLDAVDELYKPITELAENLERLFHARIQVNAYAGWRSTSGFDLHWDDHDVFILQVAGSKHWKVYPQSRLYPLAKDVDYNKEPRRDPVWQGVLEDGDLLYMPRGWWHVAIPTNEPTLHLTVGVPNPTGINLLYWMVDQLRASEIVRKDLPRFASKEEQAAHIDQIRDTLFHEFDADLLLRYFERSDAMTVPRARFSLPWSAMHEPLPPADDAEVQIVGSRPWNLKVDRTRGTVEFSSHGKRWQFAEPAEPILKLLSDGRVYSITELSAAAEGKLARQTVLIFLGELVTHGLLAITSVPGTGVR